MELLHYIMIASDFVLRKKNKKNKKKKKWRDFPVRDFFSKCDRIRSVAKSAGPDHIY